MPIYNSKFKSNGSRINHSQLQKYENTDVNKMRDIKVINVFPVKKDKIKVNKMYSAYYNKNSKSKHSFNTAHLMLDRRPQSVLNHR